jgi:hypothetical protein
VAKEVTAQIKVGSVAYRGCAGALRHLRPKGVKRQHQGVREPSPQPLHRAHRPHRIGQRDLAVGRLGAAMSRIGKEVLDITTEDCQWFGRWSRD